MHIDIRLPIGALFVAIGAVLVWFGITSGAQVYARSLGYNVNLWWGIVLLLFGGVFTWYGVRAARRATPAKPTDLRGGNGSTRLS